MTHKAVIVAAGYGSRFLPVTRVVPKELLPIVTRPALDLVVTELALAGITELLVITQRRKRALDDWFDRDPELEVALQGKAVHPLAFPPAGMDVHFVRQQQMRGTGDALRLARSFAANDPVLVAFPDDLFGDPNPSSALLDAHRRTGAAILGVIDVGDADPSAYGVIDGTREGDLWRVRRVVEKPAPGTAPSSLASVGRFLYTPALLDAVIDGLDDDDPAEQTPMPGMEAEGAAGRLMAVALTAPRWDIGRPLGWTQAVIDHALADPDDGPALRAWLRTRLDG